MVVNAMSDQIAVTHKLSNETSTQMVWRNSHKHIWVKKIQF